mmetsp:Transcript_32014/g.59588  ORF Transcript_32014/g.59588 Transcript_32014/m.59588 type:complete len:233 (-) Transcript_32014:243-941(-)
MRRSTCAMVQWESLRSRYYASFLRGTPSPAHGLVLQVIVPVLDHDSRDGVRHADFDEGHDDVRVLLPGPQNRFDVLESPLARNVQRTFAPRVLVVDVRSVLQQVLHRPRVSPVGAVHERGPASDVLHRVARSRLQEQVDDLVTAVEGCIHQHSLPGVIVMVDVGEGFDEVASDRFIAVASRAGQRSVSALHSFVYFSARTQEQRRHEDLLLPRGDEERSLPFWAVVRTVHIG